MKKLPMLHQLLAHMHEVKEINVSQLNGTLIFNQLTTEKLTVNHFNGTTIGNRLIITEQSVINKHNGTTKLTGARFPGLNLSVKTGNFSLNGVKKTSSGHLTMIITQISW